ncbi:DUF485 domain-containing protein [Burkholderia cenocepacia]|uniref:DUF485 domain-containing protein n=1 Tax=Burkholderia cenocepacia TaxID=95486 RepID=A0A6B2MID8_9BURK|nr:DUF485 domain-containing protein [Burkholderia cenocepacia]MBN3505793.1 DUF485 domain-containing protein [Burkholderia cenocepacia]MCO1392617.1 DUF485 domain-containing protein [Burkholderia cenocepacia]MCO1406566.1 DUF485 domain-containing protein [Burkholderia cenocepacia]MDI9675684.1 DUF485 domain-containing protein [Burkholderia cenocepacia]NDV75183.1 DUF485 domain-containing protein [Burkholderia cenocepacia]
MPDGHFMPAEASHCTAEMTSQFKRIYTSRNFSRLVSSRNRLVGTLLFVIFVGYFGFLGIICFDPMLAAKPFYNGTGLTLGIAAEVILFLLFLVISAIYVSFANGKFDSMIADIVEKANNGRKQ